MKRLCRECGAAVPPGSTTCPLCGKSVPAEEPAAAPARETSATRSRRLCAACGGAVPPGHTSCPHCGKVAPPDEGPSREEAAALAAQLGRETARDARRAASRGFARKVAETLLLILSVPVLLPGFVLVVPFVRRWGNVPLSLVIVEGAIFTGVSYLGFEAGNGPLAGLVFPLMLASTFASAALYVLRSSAGRADQGILLGYSGLVILLLLAGGAFFYGGAGLVLHRLRAAQYLKVISDVPLELTPAAAVGRREVLLHAILRDARLDTARAGWRVDGSGVDVFCAREPAKKAGMITVQNLFLRAPQLLGTQVELIPAGGMSYVKWVGRDWRAQLSGLAPSGRGRWWCVAGGEKVERVYLVSPEVEPDESRPVSELVDFTEAVGVLAEVPRELLESTNGFDIRGQQPGDAKGLAIVTDDQPRRWCAPVEGTAGALWVQAEGEEPPTGTLQGVMEYPEEGAGRSLARLAETARPRVLVLGTAAGYRNAHGLTTEAAEGVPLSHWGAVILGALLTLAAAALALGE